jgi:prepilin-type processing-associated H-X9-DG protein
MFTRTHQSRGIEGLKRRSRRSFTLTELLAVVTAGVVLILVAAPSLRAAATKSKTQVCLDNLRMLGICVRVYADEHDDRLPGPLHPAAYHDITEDTYPQRRDYQLSWLLRSTLGDVVTDRLITCPVVSVINSDRNFAEFADLTGRPVPPTHYGLNNYGVIGDVPIDIRATNPCYYFGWYSVGPYAGAPPVRLGAVPNADREWMIADAWYRPRANLPFPELQQEGPYQTAWTGEALPNFAPHERRGSDSYSFTSTTDRSAQSARIRQAKSDGLTNTLYFDGHAASSPARTYRVSGWEILYGFRGTVNPAMEDPPPDSPAWQGVWR